MKNKPKNIPSPYKFKGTKIFRDTTALPFADGGPLHDRNINGKLLNSTYASALGNMFREGGPFGENRGTFDYATSIYASQPGNYYVSGGQIQSQSCNPGYYWNGKECVKAKVITDPDEYARRKAAYEDSLFLYKTYNKREPKKLGKVRATDGSWHSPFKTYTKTENLKGSAKKAYPDYGGQSSSWDKYLNKLEQEAFETGDFSKVDNIKLRYVENRPISVKRNVGQYNLINRDTGEKTSFHLTSEPRFKKPVQPVVFFDKNAIKKSRPYTTYRSAPPRKKPNPNKEIKPVVVGQPIVPQPVAQENLPTQDKIIPDQVVRDQVKLDKLPIKPVVLNRPTGEIVGTAEENLPPEYPIPFTGMEWHDDYKRKINWDGQSLSYTLPRFRKPGHSGPLLKEGKTRYINLPTIEKRNEAYLSRRDPYTLQDKLVRKFSGYDEAEMEGYQGGDAYYPGEIERAQEEGRRIEFQGYRNKADIARQKEYNRAYDEYEAKKGYQDMLMKMYDKGTLPFASTSYRTGGQFPTPYSLPEDSFKQGGNNLHNSVYASSPAQYPAVYAEGGTMDTPPNCGPGYYWNGTKCIKISESKNLPTYADSLALYNNALLKKAFYDRPGSKYIKGTSGTNFQSPKVRQMLIDSTKGKYLPNTVLDIYDKSLGTNFQKTIKKENRFKRVPGTNLYQFGDILNNEYDRGYNPYAPPIMLHPKISPQGSTQYERYVGKTGRFLYYDNSDVPHYEPLAIKPASLLSDTEIIRRFKKFGKSGIPESRLKKLGLLESDKKESVKPKPDTKKEEPLKENIVKEKIVIDKLPIKPAYIDRPKKDIITQTNTTPEEVVKETDVEYTPEYSEEGSPDSIGYHYKDRQKRYIDWNGRAVGYRPLKFRKPGHSGDLVKLGGKKYFYLPTIESRTEGWFEADNDNEEEQDTYRNGGMMSRFYASNVPDNNISNKDLTYPENSYVYAQGGDLNNNTMNRYPAASRFLQKGSTSSPLTNMMSIPAKTFAYERGGKIYIKPENRGKFTASANRAGMGVQEFASHVLANKDNYSSTQVKRANFAHNAAGWKHATGGHMMAAGGWPPGLKLKNPTLSFMPFYGNTITGLTSPSAELSLDTKIGKQKGKVQKGWSISPHLGVAYDSNSKFPLSGGLDATARTLLSPNKKGLVNVNMGIGYHPAQGFGAGFGAGYNYRVLGPSNQSSGELKAGTGSLDLMPYGGYQIAGKKAKDQMLNVAGEQIPTNLNVSTSKYDSGLIYGLKGEAQWRPKLFKNASKGSAPLTFFGRGDLNFNPIRGQKEQTVNYEGMSVYDPSAPYVIGNATSSNPILDQDSGLKFKPQFSGTLGVRMPLDRVKSYMPQRKGIPAVEVEPNAGDFTYATRGIETDDKGNPILGEYSEEITDFSKRAKDWGSGKLINPNFQTNFENRGELQQYPEEDYNEESWQPFQTDYNQSILEDEDYKYGGTMNFKYGGFNNPGFNALPKDVQAKIKSRTFASGGVMPQLTEFNEGGTHEENPLGGIPQGTAGDGRLNLVEEGETKLNAANYIFSDSLKLDKGIAAAFNLPKGDVGKTFSDISKRLNRPNSRRDNDTIEQNAVQRDLENLMLAQEAFKQVDLQKDIEMMKTKHPEFMEAMDATMQQQSAQQQQPSPEEMQEMQQMQQGAPQPGSPEEQAMMEEQMMQEQMMAQQQGQGGMPPQGMSPEEMAQIPMSYGGSMYMHGGRMYMNGGHMYGKGGQVLRSIGAGAYGVGEGLLDTLTFGLTDQITDKGYDALAGIGNRDEQDLERDKMIRGFGNTAGAIGGAVVSGGATTGSAISEGFEGLDAGLTSIHGTNKEFDKTINSLAKIGSIAGSFVGGGAPGGGAGALGGLGGAGGAAGAAGAANAAQGATQASQVPQFAETLMKAGQNPFLQQVTGMAGSMMQRNGGYMYPTMYKYGGSFEMPRQQMYMPLDNVERMGGYMFAGGGLMDPPDDIPLSSDVPKLNINGKLYTKDEALQASAFGELLANPEEIEEYFADDILMPQGANTTSLPVGSSNEDNIDTDETNVLTQDEEDLEEEIYPGASGTNIITGGKGDYTDMDTLDEEILSAENMVYNSKNPTDKQKAQNYLAALKRLKTDLEKKNVDLTMKQTPMQAAGLAAPIAYNLGMGLFSKPTQLKAEDYLNKSRVSPYKVNVDPQLNEARLAYNAAEQGIRNAAPSAGAYLTNRANIAKMRTGSLGEILAKKENTDAQLQMQADAQNAQLEAQNRGTKFAIDDWNAKSKETKRKYLEKSIEQMGTLAQNAQAMDVQEKYMKLLSPQYGKTFEYQTIFDQLKDYYKNTKSSKENKV
jgi:hypothetical protein